MACALTRGRLEPCKDSVGGINAVYLIDFGSDITITYDGTDTDLITDLVGDGDTVTAYKYDLKGTGNSYSEAVQSSRDTGTTFYEQTLEISLKKLTKEDHKELRLLAYGRPYVIIETKAGDLLLAGIEYGMEVTGGTVVTGDAMGDAYGYTMTLTGMEKKPANFLLPGTGTTIAAKLTALGLTVTAGT